jgi:antitoxin HicB
MAAYKIILYAQEGGGWVAEIPAIGGCYALMDTRDDALQELEKVFRMIQEEYAESGKPLPADRTELLVHAQRDSASVPGRPASDSARPGPPEATNGGTIPMVALSRFQSTLVERSGRRSSSRSSASWGSRSVSSTS